MLRKAQIEASVYSLLALVVIVFMSGCGPHKMRRFASHMLIPSALSHLSIGMDKEKVIEKIGDPDVVRGSMKDKSGSIIEVWEYNVESTPYGWGSPYWLYFHNNKLVQWGKSGDWKDELKKIHEVRFR